MARGGWRDADGFVRPGGELPDQPTVRVLRYRQHKRDGTVIQGEWITNFSIAKLGSLSFCRMAKSRWETENGGFNDGKSRYGMEHICHHEPNSILIVWLVDPGGPQPARHRLMASMAFAPPGNCVITSC